MRIEITVSKQALRQIGLKVASKIKNNTLAGRDKAGKKFKSYSTNPFAMPSGAATSRALSKLDKSDSLAWFTTKSGAEWIVVLGGYKEYKAAAKPSHGGKVNLSFTNEMINDFNLKTVKTNEIFLGFTRSENAQKALWNKEKGRDFIGLPDDELQKIADEILDGKNGISFKVFD